MMYDVIIIGSGLSGLTCAYILAKEGYKVGIFEKNGQIGGCLQSFRRDGVSFDTGMHYVGGLDPGQTMYKYWRYLDVLKDVTLRKLDKNAFDVFEIEDKQYHYAMGYEAFRQDLSQQFPDDHRAIADYVSCLKKVALESPLYSLRYTNGLSLTESKSALISVSDYIERLTGNQALRSVLSAHWPLYAGVRNQTPLYVHALIDSSYIHDAYRLVGGGTSVIHSLTSSIKRMGGDVFSNAEVVKIHCDSSKATCIELSDGTVVEGKSFISAIHPAVTMSMLDSSLIRRVYRERINGLQNTPSNFTVYIRFKEQTVPYMNHNFFHYKQRDVWQNNVNASLWPQNYLYMHQAPDDGGNFANSALLMAFMDFNEVKQWANTKVEHRGTDYLAFKKEKAEQLLTELEHSFPGIRNSIQSYYTSSPLTYRDYTYTKNGSIYGIMRDVNNPLQSLVSQKTKIPNLFLSGQNINAHGVLGVTISAVITCSEFVGMNYLIDKINT